MASRRLRTFDLLQLDRWYAVEGLQAGSAMRLSPSPKSGLLSSLSRPLKRLTSRFTSAPRSPLTLRLPGFEIDTMVTGFSAFTHLPANEATNSAGAGKMRLNWFEHHPPADFFAQEQVDAVMRPGITTLHLTQADIVFSSPQEVILDSQQVTLPAEYKLRVLPQAFRLIT
jgi:hypothetical protein